jgi:hypothetical protein
MKWREPTFGTYFGDGRLVEFRRGRVTVIRPWPPAAWRKTQRQPAWRGCRPDLHLNLAPLDERIADAVDYMAAATSGEYDAEVNVSIEDIRRRVARLQYERDAWRDFVVHIPDHILQAIKPFPERNYAILSMAARCPGVLDLIQSNPALALMAATNWIWRRPPVKQPMRAARRLVRLKRRHIAEWLGFPGQEATVRILAKYPANIIRVKHLFYLRQALCDPTARRRLSFVPRINASVIRVVSDPKLLPIVTPTLIEEIAYGVDEDVRGHSGWLLAGIAGLSEGLGRDCSRLRVRSIQQLEALSEELWAADSVEMQAAMNMERFPFAPVTPVPGLIDQISTPRDLIAEGKAMGNCVATLAKEVGRGDLFLFRVTGPERATLGIRFVGGRWLIEQCLRAYNKPTHPETFCTAMAWLASEQELDPVDVIPAVEADEARMLFKCYGEKALMRLDSDGDEEVPF